MKSLFVTGTLAILMLLAGAARAQDARLGISLAGTGAMPVGDFADFAGLGLGAMGGLEIGAYPGTALTVRSGFIKHIEKGDNVATFIPIMGGIKFTAPETPVYIIGELGAVMVQQEDTSDDPFNLEDDVKETNLGWSAGIGAMAGALDLRMSFNVFDAQSMSDAMTLGLSIGFTFLSL
jgi:hypothetical protein